MRYVKTCKYGAATLSSKIVLQTYYNYTENSMLQKLAAKARAFIYFYLLCTSAVPLNDGGLSFDIQWACSGIKSRPENRVTNQALCAICMCEYFGLAKSCIKHLHIS